MFSGDESINLTSGIPLAWSEYIMLEEQMLSLLQSNVCPTIFHLYLSLNELLFAAIKLKQSSKSLAELCSSNLNVDRWFEESPTFSENLLFNLLCFRNFQWPKIRNNKFTSTTAADSGKNTATFKVIGAAMSAVLAGLIELSDVGKFRIEALKNYKVQTLALEIESFFRRYLYLKLFSKTYFGSSLGGLSVVAGYNNMVANFLCAISFAKACAMKRKKDIVEIADLYEAYFLIDKESQALSQLPKEQSTFYDSGFASARLFSRLLAKMCRTCG
jgi:hypothetical protein